MQHRLLTLVKSKRHRSKEHGEGIRHSRNHVWDEELEHRECQYKSYSSSNTHVVIT